MINEPRNGGRALGINQLKAENNSVCTGTAEGRTRKQRRQKLVGSDVNALLMRYRKCVNVLGWIPDLENFPRGGAWMFSLCVLARSHTPYINWSLQRVYSCLSLWLLGETPAALNMRR